MQGPVHRTRLLIFDFDGTLADSGPWLARVLNDVAARYRFRTMSGAEMATLRDRDARAVLRHLGIPAWRLPAIARDIRARMAQEIGQIRMFDGVAEMLEALRSSGRVLAIASSNSEPNVRAVLGSAAAGITWFECGTTLFGKTRRFQRVLARAGVPCSAALCIGDEVRDAEAAATAAIAFGAVGWGYNTLDALLGKQPALVFDSPWDVVRKLG